jgi:hypothetical protein
MMPWFGSNVTRVCAPTLMAAQQHFADKRQRIVPFKLEFL